ncbi:MAG: carbohydrate kinase family protein [Chloroflexi bacterium]|nr:carbohydrate kinase family protein [Chloroflexota bacterium]
MSAYVLYAAGDDTDQTPLLNHRQHRREADTLTLRHEYIDGERRQTLVRPTGRTLTPDDVPGDWPAPETLILAPLLPDEVDVTAFIDEAPQAEVAVLAQGLQRSVLPDGTIAHRAQPSSILLDAARPQVSIFLSRDEIRLWPAGAIEHLAARSARVVVTEGEAGAVVFTRRGSHRIVPVPARAIDTTGAGDVFATALILAVRAGEEFAERLAAACSAAAIEVAGPGALPSLREIQQRAALDADRAADGGSAA